MHVNIMCLSHSDFFRKVTMPLKPFVLHLICYVRKNNKQVIFSNVNDDNNDNINHTASIRPQRYNPTEAESIE